MHGKVARNPESQWLCCDGALAAIVGPACFARALGLCELSVILILSTWIERFI